MGSSRPGVSITTNSATGYDLSVHDEHDTWGANEPGGNTIPDWTGTSATPTAWAAGTAGYVGLTMLAETGPGTKDAKWGTGTTATDFVNNRYAGLDASVDTLVHERLGSSAGTDTVTVSWRADVAATQRAGAYDATLTWTALGVP